MAMKADSYTGFARISKLLIILSISIGTIVCSMPLQKEKCNVATLLEDVSLDELLSSGDCSYLAEKISEDIARIIYEQNKDDAVWMQKMNILSEKEVSSVSKDTEQIPDLNTIINQIVIAKLNKKFPTTTTTTVTT